MIFYWTLFLKFLAAKRFFHFFFLFCKKMADNVQQKIGLIALVVDDYDDGIAFYTQKLNFDLVEDTDLGDGKRWVIVAPKNNNTTTTGTKLLLAKARGERQEKSVGNQTGGRVFLFLETNNFWGDFEKYKKNGVHFLEEPREEVYGMVVVFEDLYGNKWDLLQFVKKD